ncbi:rhoGEF domain-containing protein gxcJ-like [Macrobrachium nipponense]|uniref:rhoGEF domain-containing protein gxcJ-like n=1 Tax=Macrobrachium nipponense TaxID=159736 RepID=UPI0030C7B15F
MSATNLVGLLASNANNNINNNNNDNNLNNNNVQDVNENNANNNVDLLTMVTFGAGRKRRKRESPDGSFPSSGSGNETKNAIESFQEDGKEVNAYDGFGHDFDSDENLCWAEDAEDLTAQEVTAVVSLLFLRAAVQASLTDHFGCLRRNLCVTSALAAEWGDLARVIAPPLSEFHVNSISEGAPGIDAPALLEAGRDGLTHKDSRECCLSHHCPREIWDKLTAGEWHHLIGER